MGIEELERLIAEGIQLGLKGAELRLWVDDERARLKAQREAERERLKEECEAERLALKHAQEKELAKLKQQLAVLANVLERKAEEASLVTKTFPGHKKFEDICQAASELNIPRQDIAESASQESVGYDLKHDRKLTRGNYFGKENLRLEFRSKGNHEKGNATFHEGIPLPVDDSVPTEIDVIKASAKGTAITYAFAKVNEASVKLLSLASVHPYTKGARRLCRVAENAEMQTKAEEKENAVLDKRYYKYQQP